MFQRLQQDIVMEWFNGGVAEAIAAAKSKSAVFVVVVVGMKTVRTEQHQI